MKFSTILFSALIIGAALSACGGGESDDPYAPKEILKEHQGLTLSQLKSMSSDITYDELIGHPGKGMFFDPSNPKLIGNIEKHNGTLLYSEGFVEVIFPSSDTSRITVWVCPKSEYTDASQYGRKDAPSAEEDEVEEFNCREAAFLLYNLSRGPNLTRGDVIGFSGIVAGGQVKTSKADMAGRGGFRSYHPKVSVTKAVSLGVTDWEPPMKEGG